MTTSTRDLVPLTVTDVKEDPRIMIDSQIARSQALQPLIWEKIQALEAKVGPLESAAVTVQQWEQDLNFSSIKISWKTVEGGNHGKRIFRVDFEQGKWVLEVTGEKDFAETFSFKYEDPRLHIHPYVYTDSKTHEGRWYSHRLQIWAIFQQIDNPQDPIIYAEAVPYNWQLDSNYSSLAFRWKIAKGTFSQLYVAEKDNLWGSVFVPSTEEFVDRNPLV